MKRALAIAVLLSCLACPASAEITHVLAFSSRW
jgi:hypothetical protein